MRVVSHFDEIDNGVITLVTLRCEDNSKVICEASFAIDNDGQSAVIKKCRLYIDSEDTIKSIFKEMVNTLKKYDIDEVMAVSIDGNLSKIIAM